MAPSNLPLGSIWSDPISIDDGEPATDAERTAARLRDKYLYDRQVRNRDLNAGLTADDAIDIEEGLTEEFINKEAQFIDLTGGSGQDDKATFYHDGDYPDPSPIVNFALGERELRKYTTWGGLELRKGMTIEFDPDPEDSPVKNKLFNAEFLKIAAVVQYRDGRIRLRGHMYTRAKNLKGILERKLNEVVLIADVIRNISTDWNRQSMFDHDPEDIMRVRILRTTNTAHPACGVDRQDYNNFGRDWVLNEGHLVCRWHYISVFKDEKRGKARKIDEWLVRRVTNADADKLCSVEDEFNIDKWRGGNILGGSVTPRGMHENSKAIDLDYVPVPAAQMLKALQRRTYSGGDVFSGAGGISRGMLDAKIELIFAVDHDRTATATHAKNFKRVDLKVSDIFDFITDKTINHQVDILHLSPPCQYWSPAHTIPGQNDEPNVAALYACGHVVDKVRPRIFTIEQTFGILFKRFDAYFNTFIGGFTSLGYSVRWKIIHFANWGLCQTRQRLIIIGAAPGEHLPDFPQDTHSKKPSPKQTKQGIKPCNTVKSVFENLRLRRDMYQHDLTDAETRGGKSTAKARSAWDWDRQVGTITCSGGQNSYHWSGKRDYTIREYAYIQGFPLHHSFVGKRADCVKQIGNAVPPTIAKMLYDHIVQFLRIQDGAIPPASKEAKISAARQRMEMIKVEAPAELDDQDTLRIMRARVKSGATAEQAIVINNSSGEEEEEEADDTTVDSDFYEPDKAAHSDDEDDKTESGEPRYLLRRLDQKPADETCRLDAERNKKAYSDIVGQASEASPLPKFVQTTHDADNAVSPSTPAIPVGRVTPSECPEQHVCELDGTCVPITPVRQVHNMFLAGGAYPTPAESDHRARADGDAHMADQDTMTESTHTLVGDGQRWHFNPVLQRRIIVPVSQIEKLRRTSEWALNQGGVFGLGVDGGQQRNHETN